MKKAENHSENQPNVMSVNQISIASNWKCGVAGITLISIENRIGEPCSNSSSGMNPFFPVLSSNKSLSFIRDFMSVQKMDNHNSPQFPFFF